VLTWNEFGERNHDFPTAMAIAPCTCPHGSQMSESQQTGVAAIWCRTPAGTFNGRRSRFWKSGGTVIFEAGLSPAAGASHPPPTFCSIAHSPASALSGRIGHSPQNEGYVGPTLCAIGWARLEVFPNLGLADAVASSPLVHRVVRLCADRRRKGARHDAGLPIGDLHDVGQGRLTSHFQGKQKRSLVNLSVIL
jgi:hypothetical protein